MRFSHFAAHTTILTFPTFFFFRSRVVKTGGRIAMRLDFCYMTKGTQKGAQNTSFVCALKDMLICRYVKTYNMRERSRKRGKKRRSCTWLLEGAKESCKRLQWIQIAHICARRWRRRRWRSASFVCPSAMRLFNNKPVSTRDEKPKR